jgi:hypothetical protein
MGAVVTQLLHLVSPDKVIERTKDAVRIKLAQHQPAPSGARDQPRTSDLRSDPYTDATVFKAIPRASRST